MATSNGVKQEAATIKSEDGQMAEKIMKQVEYYFGDINLPRDKFLQEEMKKDEGWISLETMLKFNRLAAITTNMEQITAALKDSHLIDVSEDNTKIRRSMEAPLPENTLEYWQEIKRRSVYLKGFPQESTLDEISEFVRNHGDVKNIVMRKTKGGKETPRVFKGSVFVTFITQEQAKQFASAKDLKFKNEHPIENKMQEEYWAGKNAERIAQRELKKQKRMEAIEQQNKAHYVKGQVLKLSGLTPAKEEDNEMLRTNKLKEFFQPYGKPVFVTFNGTEGTIRFGGSEENNAQRAWQKAVEAAPEGKVTYDGSEITGTVMEGEEEAQYWTEFSKARLEKKQRQKAPNKAKRDSKEKLKQQARQNRKRTAKSAAGIEGKKAKRTVFSDDEYKEESDGEKATETDSDVVAKSEEAAVDEK